MVITVYERWIALMLQDCNISTKRGISLLGCGTVIGLMIKGGPKSKVDLENQLQEYEFKIEDLKTITFRPTLDHQAYNRSASE